MNILFCLKTIFSSAACFSVAKTKNLHIEYIFETSYFRRYVNFNYYMVIHFVPKKSL